MKVNAAGKKDYQRDDHEDRSLQGRAWIRLNGGTGAYQDVDLIKYARKNGRWEPTLILELTRCDGDEPNDAYRQSIIARYFDEGVQGHLTQALADKLGIPAYIMLNGPTCDWFWIYSFQRRSWQRFSPERWASFLHQRQVKITADEILDIGRNL